MHSRKEYDDFMEKFLETIRGIEAEIEALSPETKQYFLDNVNSVLKSQGYTVTIGEVKWPYFG